MSQVEVQAPPGLEKLGGFRPGGRGELHHEDEELKQALVKEVTEAVREHVEMRTATVIEGLWKRGQKAMQTMQQEQLKQTAKLQGQLEKCAEAHSQLEQENALLRQGIEVLMKHISGAFGVPPQQVLPQHPLSSPATPATMAAIPTLAAMPRPPPKLAPVHSDLGAQPEQSCVDASSGSRVREAAQFNITLRRADNVPLGLELQGDPSRRYLIVVGVRPGGAVEAWNRQCANDSREIHVGDKLAAINGAEDAETMGHECITKFLLRITVIREGTPGAASLVASAASAEGGTTSAFGFRSDADEFVPSGAI